MCDAVLQVVRGSLPVASVTSPDGAKAAIALAQSCVGADGLCRQLAAAEKQVLTLVAAAATACGTVADYAACTKAGGAVTSAVAAAEQLPLNCGPLDGVCQGMRADVLAFANPLTQVLALCYGLTPACEAAVTVVLDAEGSLLASLVQLVDGCLNDANSLCQNILRAAEGVVAGIVATALACVNNTYPQCENVRGIVADLLVALTEAADECLNNYYGTCQSVARDTLAYLDSAVDVVLAVINDCKSPTGTCMTLVNYAVGVVQGVVATGLECASGQEEVCKTVLDAVAVVVARVVTEASSCLNDANSTCQAAQRLALDTINSVITLVTHCADGQDPTCATALQTVLGLVGPIVGTATNCTSDPEGTCQASLRLVVELVTAVASGDTTLLWPDPRDPDGNTGDNNAAVPDEMLLSDSDPNATAAKLVALAAVRPFVVAEMAGVDQATLAGHCPEPGMCEPPSTVNTVPDYTLYKQSTSYTCAPTSARSILKSMTGTDFGEDGLKTEMDTSPEHGTVWWHISPVLNRHQSYDHFVGAPEYGDLTADELMSKVVTDVDVGHSKPHAAILNVDQALLPYWHRTKPGRHYLTAYGYDTPNQLVVIGDVAGSHYGRHDVKLSDAYAAVVGNKGLVIW